MKYSKRKPPDQMKGTANLKMTKSSTGESKRVLSCLDNSPRAEVIENDRISGKVKEIISRVRNNRKRHRDDEGPDPFDTISPKRQCSRKNSLVVDLSNLSMNFSPKRRESNSDSPATPKAVPGPSRLRALNKENHLPGPAPMRSLEYYIKEAQRNRRLLEEHVRNAFSTTKKKDFLCSTPKASPAAGEKENSALHISGVEALDSTPISVRSQNESLFLSSIRGRNSSSSPSFTPTIRKPVTDKSKILEDIVCYVDVRSHKENHSEPIAKVLASLGAKIEKNFTKKVNLVVFKEGRRSTYIKAKKGSIPIVSVLWIEACKEAGEKVSTSGYYPAKMDHFDDLMPFQMLPKVQSLKTIEKKVTKLVVKEFGSETAGAQWIRIFRNAISEKKEASQPSIDNNQRSRCSKRLFSPPLSQPLPDTDSPITDSEDSFGLLKRIQVQRRISAPAALQRKKKNLAKTLLSQQVERKAAESQPKEEEPVPSTSRAPRSGTKTRKLFDPSMNVTLSSEESQGSQVKLDEYPIDLGPTPEKRTKTKSTSKKRTQKKAATKRNLMAPIEETLSTSASFIPSQTKRRKLGRSIVHTSLNSSESADVEEAINNLGLHSIQSSVNNDTTHVITNKPRRTMNMLKGIVRGCWILHVDWVFKSKEAGHWLPEEDFEYTNFSPSVVFCRRERQAFGPNFCMDLFSSCGTIYIYREVSPPPSDLSYLVKCCRGKVVSQMKNADVIISNKIPSTGIPMAVDPKWILDSITQNKLLDMAEYVISN